MHAMAFQYITLGENQKNGRLRWTGESITVESIERNVVFSKLEYSDQSTKALEFEDDRSP
jgi:hypothetical protein